MRNIILLLTLATMAGCQTAKPKPRPTIAAPDVAVVRAPIERAKQSATKATESVNVAKSAVARSQAIAQTITAAPDQAAAVEQLKMELNTASDDLTNAQANLLATSQDLVEATVRATVLQEDVTKLRKTAVDEVLRADTAEANLATEKSAHQKTLTAYHRIKFYIAGLAALVAGVLAFASTGMLINPLYRAMAGVAAAALVFTLVWNLI